MFFLFISLFSVNSFLRSCFSLARAILSFCFFFLCVASLGHYNGIKPLFFGNGQCHLLGDRSLYLFAPFLDFEPYAGSKLSSDCVTMRHTNTCTSIDHKIIQKDIVGQVLQGWPQNLPSLQKSNTAAWAWFAAVARCATAGLWNDRKISANVEHGHCGRSNNTVPFGVNVEGKHTTHTMHQSTQGRGEGAKIILFLRIFLANSFL